MAAKTPLVIGSDGRPQQLQSTDVLSTLIHTSGYIQTPANGTFTLTAKAVIAGTINAIKGLKTSAGTCTVTIKINGTAVTGINGLSVTSSTQDANATAANTFVAGDRITLVVASVSSAADLEFTLSATRTG